ncbi:unnamed protein product, partial [Allacma fusca]
MLKGKLLLICVFLVLQRVCYICTDDIKVIAPHVPPRISWIQPEFNDTDVKEGVVELNVTSLADQPNKNCFILNCHADYPISWLYETKTMPVVEIRHSRGRNLEEGQGKYIYNSQFHLCTVSSLFTGWYNCTGTTHPIMPGESNEPRTGLYIFLRDGGENRLLWRNSIKIVNMPANSDAVLLPCIVDTSLKDTQVQLFHKGRLYNDTVYDPKSGFQVTLKKPLDPRGVSFECRVFHGQMDNVSPDFQVVRVHPETDVEIEPKTISIPKGDGDNVVLKCSAKTAITMSRNGHDIQNKVKFINGRHVLEMESDRMGGLYSCIRGGPENGSDVLHNERIANWNVVYFDPGRQVEINMTKLSSNKIQCDAGRGFSDVEFRQSKCHTGPECKQLESSWKNRTDRCESYPPNVWEPMTRPFQGCGRSSRSCKIYSVESSGFVQCFAKELDCGGVGDSKINCDGKITSVVAKRSRSTRRVTPIEILQCTSVKQTPFSKFGLLSVEGMCAMINRKNSIWKIQCYANRRYFIGGLRWEYSFSSNWTETFPIYDNRTVKGVPGILSSIKEIFDEDNIKSTLTIFMEQEPSQDFEGFMHCLAPKFGETGEERIFTKVQMRKEKAPLFETGNQPESIELSVGYQGNLSCAVDAYPLPEILWYKQEKLPNDTEYTDIPINTYDSEQLSEFKDLSLADHNQTLIFQSFRDSQQGRYKCVARLRHVLHIKKNHEEITQSLNITALKIMTVSSSGDRRSVLIIVIVVVSVFCALALVAAFFYNRRFQLEKMRACVLTDMEIYEFINGNPSAYDEDLDIAEQPYVMPYNMAYEFAKSKLVFGKQLGSGAYGTVLKAEATGITEPGVVSTVAVKTIAPSADILYLKALLAELKVMIHIGKHTNVVSLLGACTVNLKQREVFVIVEYCQFGNLQQYLHKSRTKFKDQIVNDKVSPSASLQTRSTGSGYCSYIPDTDPISESAASVNIATGSASYQTSGSTGSSEQPLWRNNMQGDYKESDFLELNTTDLINWAYQIANGMAYLASKKVFHGDLAARNILLARNKVVKVADFGLARHVYKETNYIKSQNCPLPVKWMAIESLLRLEFSTQSDVWSFGVVLWEMFSLGYVPYPGVEVDGDFVHKLIGGYRMSAPRYCTNA